VTVLGISGATGVKAYAEGTAAHLEPGRPDGRVRRQRQRDVGLRPLAAQRLDRLPDSQFLRYALSPDEVLSMRARYTYWPSSQSPGTAARP